jgi:site-specific recombinase XerD
LTTSNDPLADYGAYLRLKGLSSTTIGNYLHHLNHLFRFLKVEPKAVATLTAAQLRSYVASLQERDLADRSVSSAVQAIKAFFCFLLDEGYINQNPADRLPTPKVGRRLPKTLTVEQVRDLFRAMDGTSRVDRRNRVLLHLCYVAGLRIGEAVSLRLSNLDLHEGTLRVVGKGNKERRIYLKSYMVELLEEYIEEHEATDYLFPGAGGGHITISTVYKQLPRYVKKAGIKKRVTPHMLRHSVAVHYLLGGAPITFVQQFLGHENLATTGIYTQLADEMTKGIALDTETAIEGMAERERERVKEAGPGYVAEGDKWDSFVRRAMREHEAEEIREEEWKGRLGG